MTTNYDAMCDYVIYIYVYVSIWYVHVSQCD